MRYTVATMSFTPRQIRDSGIEQAKSLDTYQRKAVLGMFGMVLLTFLISNMWALLWQGSDWLVATILPAVVVDLTNQQRQDTAAATLVRNPLLDEAARLKAEHMAREGYFAHYSPSGVTPWHWFSVAGYEYVHAGENLAVHFTDTRALVQAWMDSPSHRDNIVNQQFTEIGVGTARGRYQGFDTVFVVQLFGAPAQASTVATTPSTATPAQEPDIEVEGVAEAETATSGQSLAVAGETAATPTAVSAPTSDTPAPPAPTPADTDEVVPEVGEVSAMPEGDEVEGETTDVVDVPTETTVGSYLARQGSEEAAVTVWRSALHTTSTDKQPATSTVVSSGDTQIGLLGYATQPRFIIQSMYTVLSVGVLLLLLWAIRLEARRHQFVQMSYSIGLMVLMVGLWYMHLALTEGAVLV